MAWTLHADFYANCSSCDYTYSSSSDIACLDTGYNGEFDEPLPDEVVEWAIEQSENPNWADACEQMGVEPWELLGDEDEEE